MELSALVETCSAALEEWCAGDGRDLAKVAKALAGRSGLTIAQNALQCFGAIGFTTEHAFHRYLKRVLALEGLFGSADAIVLAVGRRLLAERRVPTLIEP